MSLQRRDAEDRPQTAHTWESLVERQIRDAMAAGSFDELPYQGERLPLEDDSAAGDWAMAHRMLRNAGMAPPWIESDKEARRCLGEIEALLERAPQTSPLSRGRERANLVRLAGAATGQSRGSTPKLRPWPSTVSRSSWRPSRQGSRLRSGSSAGSSAPELVSPGSS